MHLWLPFLSMVLSILNMVPGELQCATILDEVVMSGIIMSSALRRQQGTGEMIAGVVFIIVPIFSVCRKIEIENFETNII